MKYWKQSSLLKLEQRLSSVLVFLTSADTWLNMFLVTTYFVVFPLWIVVKFQCRSHEWRCLESGSRMSEALQMSSWGAQSWEELLAEWL